MAFTLRPRCLSALAGAADCLHLTRKPIRHEHCHACCKGCIPHAVLDSLCGVHSWDVGPRFYTDPAPLTATLINGCQALPSIAKLVDAKPTCFCRLPRSVLPSHPVDRDVGRSPHLCATSGILQARRASAARLRLTPHCPYSAMKQQVTQMQTSKNMKTKMSEMSPWHP